MITTPVPWDTQATMPDPVLDLVLLPGLDGSDALFEPLCRSLPPNLRPVVIPFPTAGPNDYESLTCHVRERVVGLANPVLLAWSFAGPIAIRLAADPAVAPRALILAASFASNPHPYLRAFGPLAVPWLLAPFTCASLTKSLLGGYSTPQVQRLLRRAHRGLNGHLLSKRVRAVLAVDDSQLLSSLSLPILYLRSSRDLVVPGASARRVTALCPHARVVTLTGPHLALATEPVAAAVAISAFLAEFTEFTLDERGTLARRVRGRRM